MTGSAGIGKTALILELLSPITTMKGFFLSGKFDQMSKGLAYTALADAMRDLIRQCLGQDTETAAIWRSAIESAAGSFGQVLTDIVPELEHLIGEQPAVAALSPLETTARRNTVFANFIREICAVGRPLVVFLDDLQWSDSDTLSLLETMLETSPASLLLILSYRSSEISGNHPARSFLSNLRRESNSFTNVHLDDLEADAVNAWTNDIIPDQGQVARELATLVMAKTGGNPFYVSSFLHQIIDERCIRRENDGTLSVALEAIAAIPTDDDVVGHLIKKIERLDERERQYLTRVSILGNRFTLTTASLVHCGKGSEQREAIQSLVGTHHLLVKRGETLMFAHDRVQQAARLLLADDEARALHLQAGKRIKDALVTQGAADEHIEQYVHHLNAAAELIIDETERTELAYQNAALGKRLKSNAAPRAAEAHFARAVSLLPPGPFDADHDKVMDLYTEYGETLFLNKRSATKAKYSG